MPIFMEKECIEEKIKKDLIKSSFPLELEVSIILEKNGWTIFPNEYISDEVGNNYEIDTLAIKSVISKTKDNKEEIRSFFQLIIECKKCQKHPWVFFIRERQKYDDNADLIKHAHNFGTNRPFRCSDQGPSSNLDYFKNKINYSTLNLISGTEKSTNYCQAFRDPNQDNQIYFAIRGVLRVLDILKTQSNKTYYNGRWAQIILESHIPIIVVDNNLFEGKLKKEGLEVKETKYVPLIINSGKDLGRIIIHIVRKDYLEKFLQKTKKDMEALHEEFSKIKYIKAP